MLLSALLFALPFAFAQSDSHAKLTQLALQGNGNIKLDPTTFNLLTDPKRTWSASIHLTALDVKRKCSPCKEFNPSWNAVAKAWSSAPKEHRDNHFFATLDFDDGPIVFQKLGLQSAPVVFVYPAAQGPRAPASGKVAPSKYDFASGFDAGPLAEHMSRHTPVAVPYKDPIDWARWISAAVGALCLALAVKFVSPIFQSKWTWAVVTVLTSLVMTSGYMFTRIRGMPYTGGNGNWIAAGHQNQFGQEVQVISFIYGLLGFSFLMLIMVVPGQASAQRQRLQIYIWTAVIMIVYSILVSLFRIKNRGYPFKLFL